MPLSNGLLDPNALQTNANTSALTRSVTNGRRIRSGAIV